VTNPLGTLVNLEGTVPIRQRVDQSVTLAIDADARIRNGSAGVAADHPPLDGSGAGERFADDRDVLKKDLARTVQLIGCIRDVSSRILGAERKRADGQIQNGVSTVAG